MKALLLSLILIATTAHADNPNWALYNDTMTTIMTGLLTDTQLRATPVPVSGTFWPVTQPISAAALPLPASAATDAKQDTGNTSLSSMDTKLTSQATAAKQDTGNTSVASIDTKTPSLGQATMANSRPVAIASNQSTLNVTTPDTTSISQTLGSLNAAVTISTVGMGTVSVQIVGGMSATITFYGSVDGTNYQGWVGMSSTGLDFKSAIVNPTSEIWSFPTMGIQSFRVKVTAYTSGSVAVSVAASQAFGGAVFPSTGYPGTYGAFPVQSVFNGIATDMSTGTGGAQTPRVVLATNSTLAANQSVNVAQINGVTPLMGAGNTGTGSPRVTISTDQAILTNAWKSNTAQINGVTPLMGNGATGTGSQRVTLASDGTINTNTFSTRTDTFTTVTNGTTVDISAKPMSKFSIQATATGAVTSWNVVLECGNNNSGFTTIATVDSVTNGTGNTQFTSDKPCLYFRSRMTAITLGGGTNVVVVILGML